MIGLQQQMQWHSGLCLIALTTDDDVARAVALKLLGISIDEARAEIESTCWANRMDKLRESVADQFLVRR